MITYNEFIEILDNHHISFSKRYGGKQSYKYEPDGSESISVDWSLGGRYGGWAGSGEIEPESPKELSLVDVFMVICPNISFLQYKKIEQDLVRTDSKSNWDYYRQE